MKFVLLTLAVLLPMFAQDPPKPPAGARPPRPEPKNLKILPKENLIPTMQAFNAALGVKCNHCHEQGDFAADSKHEKVVARGMLEMTKEINSKFPDGKMHVSCYTCHRGEEHPKMAADPAAAPAGH